MKRFLSIMLIILAVASIAKAEAAPPLIVDRIQQVLDTLHLDQLIILEGINGKGDKVVARVIPELSLIGLEQFLLTVGFIDDMMPGWLGHAGSRSSVRLTTRPSLQVTFYENHLELDLDRVAPQWSWSKPWLVATVVQHVVQEAISHRVRRWFKIGNPRTCQKQMGELLVGWKRDIAKSSQWQWRIAKIDSFAGKLLAQRE